MLSLHLAGNLQFRDLYLLMHRYFSSTHVEEVSLYLYDVADCRSTNLYLEIFTY